MTTLPLRKSIGRSPLRRGFLSTALLSALLGVMTLPSAWANGSFVTFDVPGAVNGTSPSSINNSGAVTGGYGDNIGSGSHGFIRAANGSFVTFDVPDAVNFTSPSSINNSGAVTGGYGDNIGSG